MINLPAIVSAVVGTGVICLLIRYTIGLLKNGFKTDFDYVMALVIVGIGVLVIVSMMLLNAKGYINIGESSANTEIVEEAIDD